MCLAVFTLLLSGNNLQAKNGENLRLIAFPNPFSTDKNVLTIMEKTDHGVQPFNAIASVNIYNYVGKRVFSKQYHGKITWSGFDAQGNRMAPGVYYVKILFHHHDGGINTQWYTVAIK